MFIPKKTQFRPAASGPPFSPFALIRSVVRCGSRPDPQSYPPETRSVVRCRTVFRVFVRAVARDTCPAFCRFGTAVGPWTVVQVVVNPTTATKNAGRRNMSNFQNREAPSFSAFSGFFRLWRFLGGSERRMALRGKECLAQRSNFTPRALKKE